MEEEDEKFWFGTVPQRNDNVSGGGQTSAPGANSSERETLRSEINPNSPTLSAPGQLVIPFSATTDASQFIPFPSKQELQNICSALCLHLLTPNSLVFLTSFKFCTVVNQYNDTILNFKSSARQNSDLRPQNMSPLEFSFPNVSINMLPGEPQDARPKLTKHRKVHHEPVTMKKDIFYADKCSGKSSHYSTSIQQKFQSHYNTKEFEEKRASPAEESQIFGCGCSHPHREHDILFINSLTSADINKLGALCGVDIFADTVDIMASKLKLMEYNHCKPIPEVLGSLEIFKR